MQQSIPAQTSQALLLPFEILVSPATMSAWRRSEAFAWVLFGPRNFLLQCSRHNSIQPAQLFRRCAIDGGLHDVGIAKRSDLSDFNAH